jgi:hypothetical protein
MSQLVNVPDEDRRRAFLRVCARHVAEDGVDDEELDRELALAGLRLRRVLGDRRTWVEVRPDKLA